MSLWCKKILYWQNSSISESVKDLIRFLKREDETCAIRQQLGGAQILQNDLLPILKNYKDNAILWETTVRYNLISPPFLPSARGIVIGRTVCPSICPGWQLVLCAVHCEDKSWTCKFIQFLLCISSLQHICGLFFFLKHVNFPDIIYSKQMRYIEN